jgi:hypothetical protein
MTGLAAAELALSAPSGGRGKLLDVAMSAVVAASLGRPAAVPAPARVARRDRGSWVIDTAHGPLPVAAPRRRAVAGLAPAPGEHTAEVLRELRLPRR